MRWMRRSRYVAREFVNEKRDDVFAPTTGAHSNNLLLASFLQMADAAKDGGVSCKPLLASMDIGDAFLQVNQENPVKCELQGCEYVILKNLPGQRLGARSWYWYFRNYLEEKFQHEFCDVQPCLGTKDLVILFHVDDILYTGSRILRETAFTSLPRTFLCQMECTARAWQHNHVPEEKRSLWSQMASW